MTGLLRVRCPSWELILRSVMVLCKGRKERLARGGGGGTWCTSAASSVESTPPLKRTNTRAGAISPSHPFRRSVPMTPPGVSAAMPAAAAAAGGDRGPPAGAAPAESDGSGCCFRVPLWAGRPWPAVRQRTRTASASAASTAPAAAASKGRLQGGTTAPQADGGGRGPGSAALRPPPEVLWAGPALPAQSWKAGYGSGGAPGAVPSHEAAADALAGAGAGTRWRSRAQCSSCCWSGCVQGWRASTAARSPPPWPAPCSARPLTAKLRLANPGGSSCKCCSRDGHNGAVCQAT